MDSLHCRLFNAGRVPGALASSIEKATGSVAWFAKPEHLTVRSFPFLSDRGSTPATTEFRFRHIRLPCVPISTGGTNSSDPPPFLPASQIGSPPPAQTVSPGADNRLKVVILTRQAKATRFQTSVARLNSRMW
ncbi:hypothetical protein C8R31_102341 [Nitrosospira sp. Nsp2]|nr:hypothetical protein C8R31_102341 [Nitrosospira sp. Nsp2]